MRLTFREVVLGVRRSPLLSTLSIVTIAFSMFAVGLFGLVALNVSKALRGLEEHVEIRAFIAEGTPIEAITTALGDIHAFPEVAKVDYVTPGDGARARAQGAHRVRRRLRRERAPRLDRDPPPRRLPRSRRRWPPSRRACSTIPSWTTCATARSG